ncbi:MAG: SDR family NAD(P)-dependent oxidoreductase [Caldilineaceae bacterium]|nr:SDR family NAD(P)-dependent oxidoreductase [Caldilineaceae bacterium]
MNLAQSVERGARLFPQRLALHFEEERFTYARLHDESNRAANGWTALGIGRGDRVAIWLPNTAAFVIAYLGLQKIGAVAVTINTALKAAEVGFILHDSGARLLLTTATLAHSLTSQERALLQQLVVIEGEVAGAWDFAKLLHGASTTCSCAVMAATDPAVLLYTSGTTGFPKGALLSHGALITAIETAIPTLDLQPTDRVLLALSIFHSFAQTAALLPCLAAGGTVLLQRQFEVASVLQAMETEAATFFFGVPTLYILLQAHATLAQLHTVRRYISAGAPLPVAVAEQWHATYGTPIHEGYGLTELCLASFNHRPLTNLGSVGTPLPGVQIQVVDETGTPVPTGQLGEVIVQSPSAMLAYWQRPTATAAVLRGGWFHTGDIGRLDAAGALVLVDRVKDMINVGGVKVYPSEVEQLLYQHPAVSEVAVYGVAEPLLGEQVQAAVVLKAEQTVTVPALLTFCRQHLAAFKVPSRIDLVAQLPKSRTGKILKRFLREQKAAESPNPALDPTATSPVHPVAAPSPAAVAALAQWTAHWLAEQLQLTAEEIGGEQPFADYGLTSVLAVSLAQALAERLGRPVPAILLWNFPTITALVHHLLTATESESVPPPAEQPQRGETEPIAVIGIGCRFPGGANTPEQFWDLLRAGVDTVRPIPAARWPVADYYDPTPNRPGKIYVRAGHFLDGIDQFDASFFGITPLEAASLDPQQRLLLEVCWEALEHANLAADRLRASQTGVYVGTFWDDYSAQHLYNTDPTAIDSYRLLSNLRGMSAGRLAYVLGLHGPVMQLDTACSSSLLAVHLACQALRAGECALALAGGVNLILAPEQLIGLCHMGAVAPDGRCKTFAADADGFGVGEGAGIVVLKRLSDAQRDGDSILAVVRGSAVNHDGASNGLTAPNGRAQAAMVRQALANAAVQPAQIQYVETHGTGTVLGDPIEVQALHQVLGQARTTPLFLGSVKTNIGHLAGAAGIAALIKVTLALAAGEIPASLHFTTPNPHIPWSAMPIAVPTSVIPWPDGVVQPVGASPSRRLAGVSSFGLTGTNVHLIVEEAPLSVASGQQSVASSRQPGITTSPISSLPLPTSHLLPLSAQSEPALLAQLAQYEQWLTARIERAGDSAQAWADLCYTAATSRTHWEVRHGVVATDLATARAQLQQARQQRPWSSRPRPNVSVAAPRVAFLFPGQGPQYSGMGRQLYATQPLFRRTLQECAELLDTYLDQPLLPILYGADQTHTDRLLNEATYAQPALFALAVALATLWRSWGVEPTVLMGHSLGEYAAAYLAGVFSLDDGAKLVAARGRLMQTVAPQGQMVAVLGHADTVRALLAPLAESVSLAAINTPQSVVIAGEPAAIAEAVQRLEQAGLSTRPLKIYVASHSPLMEPILPHFAAVAQQVTYHRPQLPVVSNLTGALADEELTTPAYWCRHLREPVQFAQGMATVATLGIDAWIEMGPKATLLTLGQQYFEGLASSPSLLATPLPAVNGTPPYPSSQPATTTPPALWLPSLHPKRAEEQQLLESVAALYGRGASIDWHRFYARAEAHQDQSAPWRKVTLPRYPFQRQRYWLETQPKPVVTKLPGATTAPHPLLGRPVASAVAARNRELLYENHWALTTLPELADHTLFDQPIVPGAAYLEMSLAVGAQRWPQANLLLTDCTLAQGLFLPTPPAPAAPTAGATVQLIATPAGTAYHWQIYSLLAGAEPTDPWTLHATGTVAAVADPLPPPLDLAAIQARCQPAIAGAIADQRLRDQGIGYGPAFQTLAQLWVGTGEALGYVTLPAIQQAMAQAYQIHPALLDGALRVASSCLPHAMPEPYLPFAIERVHLGAPRGQTHLWSYVQAHPPADPLADTQQVDLTLADEDGTVVAHFTNFTLRRAHKQRLVSGQRRLDWLYALEWQLRPRATRSPFSHATGGQWLILADRQGRGAALAAQLEAQGELCTLLYQADDNATLTNALSTYLTSLPANLRGIIYLWPLDTLDRPAAAIPAAALQLTTQLLQLVQGCLAAGQTPRLWVVTQQAVGQAGQAVQLQQAPLWGMARTLQLEHPELACTAIDLAAGVSHAALFAEIWQADEERQLLLRGAERRGARLVRHPLPTPLRLPTLDGQSSYLVTGGLGGLGLVVAQWLVQQGARHLVLVGRRGAATPGAEAALAQLTALGAQVTVVAADLADAAAVQKLLTTCQAVAPLRGIIHAAGVIDDGLFQQQTAERLAQVMAPKVAGTWHLHRLTEELPLDFFVCFSSVASLLGNGGQSNYAAANAFLDALAYQRHYAGRPALSINWGGWAEVGLAATLVQEHAAAGLGAIAPAQGATLLGLLMAQTTPQVAVLPIEWRTFQQTAPGRLLQPLLGAVREPEPAVQAPAALRQELATAPAPARRAILHSHLQALVTTLLGTTPADDESFFLFGLDSLLSIQLANRLAAALDLPLPATLAFQQGTLATLTQFLCDRLGYATADPVSTDTPSAAPVIIDLPDWYPQLYNQRECFTWHATVDNKAFLHIQQSVQIHSPVDVACLEAALQALVARHEALRTVYTRQGPTLRQQTLATSAVDFALIEVEGQPQSALAALMLTMARQPFDLEKGPLLRGRLLRRSSHDHLLLLVVHHIAADATALSVLVNELWVLYGALQSGQPVALPPVHTTWRDFVRWQMGLLQSQAGQALGRYWQTQIGDAPTLLALPTDYPRPGQDSHHGEPAPFVLDAQLTHQLRQLAQQEGCTLYAVLMTGFQLLLHTYTQQRDLLIAAHVANRNQAAFAEVVGYLADTFPIRAQIPAGIPLAALLKQVQATLLAAMEHQGFPLRLLAEQLQAAPSDPTQTALCQVWFTLLPLRLFQASSALFQPGAGTIELGGLTLEGVELVPAWLGAWYDLEMILTEGEEVVFGTLVYKTDLFAANTVARMIRDFQVLLQQIAALPALSLPIERLATTALRVPTL